MDPETLLARARELCTRHRVGPGFCSSCFQLEMAAMLCEENPALYVDDAINLVSEWMLAVDEEH